MTTPHQASKTFPATEQGETGRGSDLKGAQAAIRRAAQRARLVAQQTGTDLIVVRAGVVVRVQPKPERTA